MSRITTELRSGFRSLTPMAQATLRLLLTTIVIILAVNVVVYVAFRLAINNDWQTLEPAMRTINRYISVDGELTIPAWFSGGLWFVASAVALVIANARSPVTWFVFAGICALLSLDEIIGFHEGLGALAQRLIGNQTGLLNFEWIIFGALLAVAVAAAGYQAVRTIDWQLQLIIYSAGIIFIVGALGFEAISGLAIESGGTRLFYRSMTWVEEGLEMMGVSLLLATLVSVSGLTATPSS